MSLASLSVRRPVLAIVMSLTIVLFGLIGMRSLGVREFPSVDPPVITVRTSYAGANADVIESQITEPLEKAINGIAGVRSIASSSNQGTSNIRVEFNIDSDLEAAANDVRDKVSQAVRSLPQDLDGLPTVTKSDANSDAILALSVYHPRMSVLQLSEFAENVLVERFQTIPGVSNVQIYGQKRYAMRLWMEPERLAAFGLTPMDVLTAVRRENVDLPAGKIAGDRTELTIRTSGRLRTEEDFSQLILKSSDGRVVRFQDVGRAELGPEVEETILRRNGVGMVAVALVPQPGANYIEIADEFYRRLEDVKKQTATEFTFDLVFDNTRFVRQSLKEVEETLAIAVLLVVLIIYLFFRDWVIAFRPLIDIPVSLIGAFFVMYALGYSINVLTLLAIVLATGLVVDDGIVVTENIFKKVEQGMEPVRASIEGTREIFFAVVSTSVTLAVVFLPVVFMEGVVGRLFREFGVVLASAVLISAFVSLTLTPMLNARLVRKNRGHGRFYERTEPFFVAMVEGYGRTLARFMERRVWGPVALVACTLVIAVLFRTLPAELAPLDDRSFIRLLVSTPEGTSFETTDAHMRRVASFIADSLPEARSSLTVTSPGFTGSGAVNSGFARIILFPPDERGRTQQQLAEYMTGRMRAMPEARTSVVQDQTIAIGGPGSFGQPVQYVLQAPDFETLKAKLPLFLEQAMQSPVLVNADANLKFNKPEFSVSVDREKAGDLGVAYSDVAQTLQLAYSGQRFSYFNMGSKQYQVIGQVNRVDRDDPSDLRSVLVRNKRGELVQLDNLIRSEEASNPPSLFHYNRYVSATVSAGLAPGYTVGDGIAEMRRIHDQVLDDSFRWALTGPSRDFAETSSNLVWAFALALLLVYLVLAAQFESFVDPLIIMLTVPLALAGALLTLWYFNQTLNIFSQIGMIMLVGLVTKNGILIVEFANQLRDRGLDRMTAIRQAAEARLRPILMTSLATALGALPIALALGAGANSRKPMGMVVIGGLLFSLVLTLYVIPTMYAIMSRRTPKGDEA
ncbi:MAG: hypothetical protein RL721_1689 [Candidatus Eisenbacteria bacterium]